MSLNPQAVQGIIRHIRKTFGIKGDKGPVGDKGPTGDKGATGDKGETGDAGEDGSDGSNAVVDQDTFNSFVTKIGDLMISDSVKWNIMGSDIEGDNDGDNFGFSVAMNNSGRIVAIGAYKFSNNGLVRIFEWNGTSWNQLGSDIIGDNNYQLGHSVDFNEDGTILACHAIATFNADPYVEIYEYDGANWILKGSRIIFAPSSTHNGMVQIDGPGSNVIVSDFTTVNLEHTKVYQYDPGTFNWVQLGNSFSDNIILSNSINKLGTIIAYGVSDIFVGHVKIFQLSGNSWVQIGDDIITGITDDGFGISINLNGTGTRIAIGAFKDDDTLPSNDDRGSVRVYQNNNNSWDQIGQTIYGKNHGNNFGRSVKMNDFGDRIIVGSPNSFEPTSDIQKGHASMFQLYENNGWVQIGQNIIGNNSNDFSQISVGMNELGTRVIVGGSQNDSSSPNPGYASIHYFPL